ncbi:terpene cyclase/mutase family protein [Gemmata sp. G18]|uniref:Terpene cyclase/mutase family protein n=1 Tax=Gemmata palustris TaxID=2822762 RepID=A0ABS5BR09_9BACT|nr:prenyltransferase/squalene oxidase repeat-containing protein [Gemmata palustris]MBP3956169.1 terpene cyclase/mutase family protein [Gemmata palustris]
MSALNRRDWLKVAAVAPAALVAFPRFTFAAPSADDVKAVVDKALGFYKTAQKDDGSFGSSPRAGEPGLTALIISALVKNGVAADNPTIAKGLKYLESKVQKDGGVYDRGLSNYMTCLAIMTFKEANAGGKYDKVIEAAAKYVKSLQFADGLTEKDAAFGGAGYDKPNAKGRPDMSNTHFMVEALLASGVSKDDPSIKRALVYISRSQNLATEEFNNLPFAKKAGEADKGGFVYNLSDADNPKSPKITAEGGLRSEGGMTYAGLKSFLYAGVGKDDKRVQAAVTWVRQHYSVTENPGQKDSGLYYYYHTFAKAMDALGEDQFADAKGTKHDWRQELFDELKKKQKENGSWANSNGAFLENLPELATAFAVLSISYCKKK